MSRRRYVSTDISTDVAVAALASEHGPLPALLYTWAIPHADDWGRLTGDATQFHLTVCPGVAVTTAQVGEALDQVAAAGLWERYEAGGRKCIAFPREAWNRHQTYIPASKRTQEGQGGSVFPPPPPPQNTEEHRKTPTNTEEHRKTPQNTASPSPSPSPSPSGCRMLHASHVASSSTPGAEPPSSTGEVSPSADPGQDPGSTEAPSGPRPLRSIPMAVATPDPPTPAAVVGLWNSTCGAAGLPQASALSPERAAKIRARTAESQADEAWWRDYFGRIARAPFLSGRCAGRDGGPPFRASLDWAIRSRAVVLRVLEGNYDDRGSQAPPPDDSVWGRRIDRGLAQ